MTAAEHRPLDGRRVLLPVRRDRRLAEAIRAAGAEVVEVALTTVVPEPEVALAAVVEALVDGGFDWVAITSARTPSLLAKHGVARISSRVACVGEATAAAARQAGLRVDLVPSSGSGATALAAAWPVGTGRVALPGSRSRAPKLASRLRRTGWQVTEFPVYDSVALDRVDPSVAEAWASGGFDAFVVTAGSVARAAAALLHPPGPPIIALGVQASAAAMQAGLGVCTVAASAAVGDVVAALVAQRKGEVR